jgi:hypothetical protein
MATLPAERQRLCIFRPATLSGDNVTGASNLQCFTVQTVCGLVQLGWTPPPGFCPMELLLTPVDWAARAMVKVALAPESSGVFHVCTPRPLAWDTLVAAVRRHGHVLQEAASEAEWHEIVRTRLTGPENPLLFFREQLLSEHGLSTIERHAFPSSARMAARLAALSLPADSSIGPAAATSETLLRQLDWLSARGCIPPPQADLSGGAEEAQDREHEYVFEAWYANLHHVTFPSSILPLAPATMKALLALFRLMDGWQWDPPSEPEQRGEVPRTFLLQVREDGLDPHTGTVSKSFSIQSAADAPNRPLLALQAIAAGPWGSSHDGQRLRELCAAVAQVLEPHVAAAASRAAFARLSTRSPKDSTWLAARGSLSVSTPEEVVLALATSGRVRHDLRMALLKQQSLALIIRDFVAFERNLEFRVFVFQGRVTAASLYHRAAAMPHLLARRSELSLSLESFCQRLTPRLPADCTIDVVLNAADLAVAWVIEVNHPPPVLFLLLGFFLAFSSPPPPPPSSSSSPPSSPSS